VSRAHCFCPTLRRRTSCRRGSVFKTLGTSRSRCATTSDPSQLGHLRQSRWASRTLNAKSQRAAELDGRRTPRNDAAALLTRVVVGVDLVLGTEGARTFTGKGRGCAPAQRKKQMGTLVTAPTAPVAVAARC
jgi:hypothetical protein